MNLVLYHGACTDGFTSALLMYLFFKATGQEAEFKPVNYNEPIPTGFEGKNLYILDFSYSTEVMEYFAESAKSITMLDHHETAADMYQGYGERRHYMGSCPVEIRIDKDYSGAGLTFKYLSELELNSCPLDFLHNPRIQKLVYGVQDYDLWLFKCGNTRIYNELLQMIPKTLEMWEQVFLHENEEEFEKRFGKALNYHEVNENLAQNYAKKHEVVKFCGYQIPVVNVPRDFANRVCEILNEDKPFSMSFVVSAKELYCSLRSRPNTVDVSEVAELFGGGGHKTSAGFRIHPRNATKLLSGKLKPNPRIVQKVLGWFKKMYAIFWLKFCAQ